MFSSLENEKDNQKIFEDVEQGSPGDHLDSLRNLKNEVRVKYKRLFIINSYLTVRLESLRRDETLQKLSEMQVGLVQADFQ